MDLERMGELSDRQMFAGLLLGIVLSFSLVAFSCVQVFQYLECEKAGRTSCMAEAVLS